jgi:Zn-dependent membrane protease YugP
MFFDPKYFLIVGPGILLAMWAAYRVKSTFARYSKVAIANRMSGAEVARELLRREGIRDVGVELHQGFLSDHYHPDQKVVRLSPSVYQGRSAAAVGVAAHEVGHAIQHAARYAPMKLRQTLVAPANLGTNLSYILVILGLVAHSAGLMWLGIALFSAVVLFQLVTLPVEWNASKRAKASLVETGIVSQSEAAHVGKVLNAAALTYLAALITSILTLLYFILRASDRR